jgi:aspartate racemase
VLTVFTVGQKYKKIGILGGMGPEATAELYLKIIKIFQDKFGAKYDSDYPEIMIYNLPLPDVVEKIDQSSKIKEMLVKGVQKLESWGVDFIAIPCNTVNFFLPEMRTAVSIPILSILEETAKEVNKLELKKVAVLGTEMTISSGIYQKVLPDISLIVPKLEQQQEITEIILNVLAGKKIKSDLQKLKSIIKELKINGAEKVILGCTELPLLIKESEDTINTIDILAKEIVKKCINLEEK